MEGEKKRGFFQKLGMVIGYLFDATLDGIADSVRTVLDNMSLFLGSTLALIGLLSFEAGKFCDGNTADYLSCTRPATYYYFDSFDKILLVIGIVLVLVWVVKRK